MRPQTATNNRMHMKRVGIALVILSCVLYGAIFALPFFHLPFRTKAFAGSFLVIGGEISFWVGGFILGREAVARYRGYLNPKNWFRKTAPPSIEIPPDPEGETDNTDPQP